MHKAKMLKFPLLSSGTLRVVDVWVNTYRCRTPSFDHVPSARIDFFFFFFLFLAFLKDYAFFFSRQFTWKRPRDDPRHRSSGDPPRREINARRLRRACVVVLKFHDSAE